jgi:hypothetical protein
MDVGMAPAADEPHPKTITQLIAEGRAPLDLSDEDAIYVFDALLAGLCLMRRYVSIVFR